MMTSGIYSVLGLVIVAMSFAAISYARGARFAFLAICWLPLAGLFVAVGAHHHLGYAMIGVLASIVLASVAIIGIGVYLCAKAVREKTELYSATIGIVIAALPLVILLARW
jgi:hypothetical protein